MSGPCYMTANTLKSVVSILLLTMFFSCISCISRAKEMTGGYAISGTAFDAKGNLLINDTLIVNGKRIITDQDGRYRYLVEWRSIDKHYSFWKRAQGQKAYNPKWIIFEYNGTIVRKKNEWKKFWKAGPSSEEPIVHYDLHF